MIGQDLYLALAWRFLKLYLQKVAADKKKCGIVDACKHTKYEPMDLDVANVSGCLKFARGLNR